MFNDASRNVNAFAKMLPAGTPVVHVTSKVGQRAGVDPRVEQIIAYLYSQSIDDIARAKVRARRLGEG